MAKREVKIKVDVDAKSAVKGTEDVNKGLNKVSKSAGETKSMTSGLSDSLDSVGGATGGVIQGAKGMLTQFTKLVMHPVGAVLAAIALTLGALYKAFTRSEEGSNKLSKGMAVLSGAFNRVLSALEPLANFLVDNLIVAFEKVGEVADKVMGLVGDGLRSMGWDEAANGLEKFNKQADKAIKDSKALADADAELIKLKREQGQIDLKTRLDAEKMRQLRDDESNSLQQRIEYNKQLGQILLKGAEDERVIVNKQLAAALMRQKIEGSTTAVLDEIAEAKLAILEVDERSAGFQSEMLANENSLRNEGKAKAKEEKAAKDARLKEEAASEAKRLVDEENIRLKEEEALKQSGLRKIQADIELKLLRAELGLNDPNATQESKDESFAAKIEAMNSQFAIEQQIKKEQLLIQGATEAELKAQELLDTEKHQNELGRLESERIEKVAAKEAEAKAYKIQMDKLAAKGTVDTTQQVLGDVSSLLDEGSKEAKAIALAQATISGIQGVQAAFTSAAAVPVVGAVLAPIAATAAGLVAAKNVQQIANSKTGGKSNSAGGGSSFSAPRIPSANLSNSASSPALREDSLFSTQTLEGNDTQTLGSGRGKNQKVYVLESDISATQNKINTIETGAEIG